MFKPIKRAHKGLHTSTPSQMARQGSKGPVNGLTIPIGASRCLMGVEFESSRSGVYLRKKRREQTKGTQ